MLYSGLASVTFRELSPRQIVDLVTEAGLEGIEWGGDIHVPHGDLPRAREARRMTLDAGIRVSSYGSYYRVEQDDPALFEAVLESACELGAPIVRVWAGGQGSEAADEDYRSRVVSESQRISALAAKVGVTIAYESHLNTLTDTAESTKRLLEDVACDNVRTYWQKRVVAGLRDTLTGLELLLPWLSNVHAFYFEVGPEDGAKQMPLADGEDDWRQYLSRIVATGRDHFVMLEFVRDDAPENFLKDAATLKRLLSPNA